MPMAAKINDFGLLGADAMSDSARSTYGPLLDAQVDEDLVPVLQAVRQRVSDIGKDGRLTTEGKVHAFRLAGSQAHDRLEQLHATRRRKLEQDASQVKAPTRLPVEAEYAKDMHLDPLLVHERMKELRHALTKLDPVERKTALSEAAQQGDVALLIAAQGFHPFVRPVRSSDLQTAIAEYIETHTPPEALAVREAMTQYDANHRTAQTHIGEMTGVQSTNAHARLAAKRASRPQMFDEGREADDDTKLP